MFRQNFFQSSFILPDFEKLTNFWLSHAEIVLEDELIRNAIDYITQNIEEHNSFRHSYNTGVTLEEHVKIDLTQKICAYILFHSISPTRFRAVRFNVDLSLENPENNNILVRITSSMNSISEILMFYINENSTKYGIFTEMYEQPNTIAFHIIGDPTDVFIRIVRTSIDNTNNPLTTLTDRLFEESRQETIEKTYSETQNHEIIIDSETVIREESNDECQLCFEKSFCLCKKCRYPICEECLKHFKFSTGLCPCCRDKLTVCKIVDFDDSFFAKTENYSNTVYEPEETVDKDILEKEIDLDNDNCKDKNDKDNNDVDDTSEETNELLRELCRHLDSSDFSDLFDDSMSGDD